MVKKQKAILFMIISTFFFTIMQIAVKVSSKSIPLMEQVFCRNLVTLFVAFIILKKENKFSLGKIENQKMLFIRSILGFLGVVMYFYATKYMLAADATILHRSSPFFVTIFSVMFLKEKLTKTQIGMLITAFIGAILVIRPQFNSDVIPSIVGLASAVVSGGAYTAIGYLKNKEDSMVIVLHFSLLSCLICIPFMMFNFVFPSIYDAFMLLVIGICAGLGQIFLTISYKNAPASEVSIYNFSGIIFACIMGFVFLGELVDIMSILGMTVIIISAIILYISKKNAIN